MKVIVVDDEKLALNSLLNSLKKLGFNEDVKGFLKSSEALLEAKTFLPDIAFLDIEMPCINGIELAHKLKKINPKINIIFTTGYSEYMKEAFDLFASGYLLKPINKDDLKKQIENLRFLPDMKKKGLYAHTFGYFDFYKNGESVEFSLQKAKEMLAYLIHNNGASVTKKELCAVLFEEAYTIQVQDYFVKIVKSLKKTLKEINEEDFLIQKHNSYAIDSSKFSSDEKDYCKGIASAINSYQGEYMVQYSWAEGLFDPDYR